MFSLCSASAFSLPKKIAFQFLAPHIVCQIDWVEFKCGLDDMLLSQQLDYIRMLMVNVLLFSEHKKQHVSYVYLWKTFNITENLL